MEKLNEIIKRVNEYWNNFWKWIDKLWTLIKKWKYWEAFLVVFLTISLILILVFFNSIASALFTSDDRNGELTKTLLSVFGGIGIFYGLFINSKRIKEQTRQNNISENSNSDKRFGDAVGFLDNENQSIVLGGIYALYQLAKEDIRYRPIVANLYTSYLQDRSFQLYQQIENDKNQKSNSSSYINVPIIVRTLFDLLFNTDNTFKGIPLNLSYTYLQDIIINSDLMNCNFDYCKLIRCQLMSSIRNCSFKVSQIRLCNMGGDDGIIEDCDFARAKIYLSYFSGNKLTQTDFRLVEFNSSNFSFNQINYCEFDPVTFVGKVSFINVKSFIGTTISSSEKDKIKFNESENIDQIFYI